MVNVKKEPLVSVITATLNASKYLREALNSILNQTYQHIEVLIIDGGSTDDTKEIANLFPKVSFVPQNGKGLFDAWNQGIQMCTGEFVAILDSDDIWNPTTLSDHVNALLSDSSKLGSVGQVKFFLEKKQTPPPEFKLSLLEKSHLAYMPGCFMGRKEIFNRIGYYETEWKIASDIIWFGKVKDLKDEIYILNRVVLNKRVHKNNISYNSVEEDIYGRELLKLLHLKLKSKRG
jgi:glycosyltransferase involved in cell wall biosynthesis